MPSDAPPPPVAAVDEVLPAKELATFGLQHVLGMYAGAVAVPLIVGAAFKVSAADMAVLIAADIFTAGIATALTCIGVWKIGARLPIMQGCTFAAVGPIVAAAGQGHELTDVFGAIIIAGLIAVLLAPVIGKLRRFFPPLVVGTVILLIGISLLPVAVDWAGDVFSQDPNNSVPNNLALAVGVLIFILLLQRFANEWIKRTSIMIGIIAGTLVAIPLGFTDFGGVSDSNVFGVPTPFHFGAPTFAFSVVITMVIVMIVSMIETTGDLIAVGEIVGKEADEETIVGGLRADGLSSALGGIFNTFPYTAYAENVGLVSLSGVKSRWVVATAGGIMIVLGLFPILGAVVAAVPLPVLGGAGLVMFGTVAAIGAKTLNKVDFDHRGNLIIVATALGIGLVPVRNEAIYADFPQWFTTVMGSGITAGTVAVVALNYIFNELGVGSKTADALGSTPPFVGAEEVANAASKPKQLA
jgi:xanthine permease